MPEENPKYYAVLTEAGGRLEARALAEGRGVVLTHIVVGDAKLQDVIPSADVTELVHEVCRRPIEYRSIDKNDPNVTLLHAVIPASIGGFWVRELGVVGRLEAEAGGEPGPDVLYAYANHAPYYKMLPQDGQTVTHEIVVPITTSSSAKITIVVSDQGYVTKSELDAIRNSLPGEAAFVELAANLVAVSNRLTQLEVGCAASGAPAVTLPISPAGYQLGDATIAPVTIVPEGAQAPAGAAFVVNMENRPTNP